MSVPKSSPTHRWTITYYSIVDASRGKVHLDDEILTREEALEVVNRWNSQQIGRFCYVLVGREHDKLIKKGR